MTEWIELDDPKQGGCTPCCAKPHGWVSLGASIAATLAWIFGLIGLNSCEFLSPNGDGYLYCHPPAEPKAQYGSCGATAIASTGTSPARPTRTRSR
ncbi:hypothetical protein ACHAXT_012175 [Thalassiosira profunda]